MNNYQVFDFLSFSGYLVKVLGDKSLRKGTKSKAAKYIGCHTTLISQIIHGSVLPSLETAEKLSQFLNHSEDEKHYFLLILQFQKASTVDLKKYFKLQIDEILKNRDNIKKRIGKSGSISDVDELRYYSHWSFAATHVALSIPGLNHAAQISERFTLPEKEIKEILNFLIKIELAIYDDNGNLQIGPKHIHLGNDSKLIRNHHVNWRQQAIKKIDSDPRKNFHYSSALTLSHKDKIKVKELLICSLKDIQSLVTDSKEETACCLNFDFFDI